MFGADSRLSLAASEIWSSYEQEDIEMSLDGSGELGGQIARHMQEWRVARLAAHGFTPQEYNEELRRRLAPEFPRMSYRIHTLLGILEVEPMDQWLDDHAFVCTLGYPGHPGAEYSSLSYLKGE